ncbi:MAG: hypothetical protein ACI9EK_002891 [Psychroserpens sp.]|jgi:hypothetical protein
MLLFFKEMAISLFHASTRLESSAFILSIFIVTSFNVFIKYSKCIIKEREVFVFKFPYNSKVPFFFKNLQCHNSLFSMIIITISSTNMI